MKTLYLSLLVIAATACSSAEEDRGPALTPAPTATDPAPAPPAPKRTMGTARAMGTRPENLVFDPTFGSLGTQYSQAALVQDVKAYVDTPATSPAGPAQPVLVAQPSGAQAVVVLAVQAGTGPLDVRLFIASKDAALPTVTLTTPDGNAAFDVAATESGAQKHGDRTYKLYTAHVTEELLGKVYLIIQPAAGELVLAAPEVTSPAAPGTRSLVRAARRVTLTPVAASAAHAMASLPLFHGAREQPPRWPGDRPRLSIPIQR